MRDPTVNVKVEAAVQEARRTLDFFLMVGGLGKSDPEGSVRRAARRRIARLTDDVLPEHMRDYVCRVLEEQPAGRSTYSGRNMFIAHVIEQAAKRGFAPTRNAASRGKQESACSIVAAALGQVGIHMSERTVEEMWASHTAAVREIQRKKSRTTI